MADDMHDDLPADTVLAGAPLPTAAHVVVVVHGRDQDPAYMIEHFVDRLDLAETAFVLPAAPQFCWYPGLFTAPLADNEPELSRSLGRLDEIDSWLTSLGRSPDGITWCGFSQGASLVCTYVLRSGSRRHGVVGLTGGLIGPPGTRFVPAGRLDATNVYLSASESDDWLPVERAQETAEAFRAAGATVTLEVFPDRSHRISDEEVAAAKAIIAGGDHPEQVPSGEESPGGDLASLRQ
jgi:phospholipase/carboxylesterase